MGSFRFAVAATFTAEPLERPLLFWGDQLGGEFEVRFAPYNQVLQTLLNPGGEFRANTKGLNVILARVEDLGTNGQAEKAAHELVSTIREAAPSLACPLVVGLCPPNPECTKSAEWLESHRKVEELLASAVRKTRGAHYLPDSEVRRLYPVADYYNSQGDQIGKIPYTEAYYCALATTLVRLCHALHRPPFKVIAVDCDNTLWKGICGEDGPEGVEIDPPRQALQEFLRKQWESGALLCMVSKNNEQDVLDTFAAHPSMPLELSHFVSNRINWEPKADNLRSLAEELSLGLDSFIFLDDNPKECAEVAEGAPEVLALPLPERIEETSRFLNHVWAFDRPVVTEEDRQRNASYVQTLEFGREVKRARNLEEFVAGLNLQVRIEPVSASVLPRAAQLTQRTNQFNCTTIRRTEQELQALMRDGYECRTVEVADRFGEYGITGLVITHRAGDALRVDTFLLSCRVLGRSVEHQIMRWLGEKAAADGLNTVVVPFIPTRKNSPARQFLLAIAEGEPISTQDGFEFRFDAARLKELRYQAPKKSDAPAVEEKPAPVTAQTRSVDYGRIARDYSTVDRIVAAVRSHGSGPGTAVTGTETEQKILQIWSEILQRPCSSVNDNFFDLGGHSLLVVLLLMRIRETFDVELPVDVVYSGDLTVASLARAVEAHKLGITDPEEYAELLAEIESLSEEEARALLMREDPETTHG
ncbi:MAG: HAD-IIIC family phosphatase [Bryobacteraceae bacterium]|nr:HAD-IIIC family phosphatase [Bryobacteraceae bacterium]